MTKADRQMIETALKMLPEGCSEIYSLRTRLVICSQVAENAAEEVLTNMMRRGEPEEADQADCDLAINEIQRGLSAFIVLASLLEKD